MTDYHEISQKIYDFANDQMAQCCEESCGQIEDQYNVYLAIACEVSSYLMANALLPLSSDDRAAEMKTLNENVSQILQFIEMEEQKPKN